jgi:excisionase family DNA binding protein
MVLKVPEVAKRLNCSTSTVYALIEGGTLGYHRCPGIRVSEGQIEEYLEKTRREPAAPVRRQAAGPRPRVKRVKSGWF